MKFAEHLGAHITPEWRKQYIQYEEMKAMLYESIQEAPSSEVVEPEVLTRYFAKFDETFFILIIWELLTNNRSLKNTCFQNKHPENDKENIYTEMRITPIK